MTAPISYNHAVYKQFIEFSPRDASDLDSLWSRSTLRSNERVPDARRQRPEGNAMMLATLDGSVSTSPWIACASAPPPVLVHAYDEVVEAALFIERATPAARTQRFPSLVASSRSPRHRKAAKTPAAPKPPSPPTP